MLWTVTFVNLITYFNQSYENQNNMIRLQITIVQDNYAPKKENNTTEKWYIIIRIRAKSNSNNPTKDNRIFLDNDEMPFT